MSESFASLESLPPPLLDILGAFASLTPVKYLKPLSHFELPFNVIHDYLLKSILLNPHFGQYSPARQYQITFWKWVIQQLEGMIDSEDDTIDSQIYEHYVNLMCISSSGQIAGVAPPSPSYLTYFWRDGLGAIELATLLESRTTIESGTTGLKTWPASLTLAGYLINNPEIVRKKRVLELGCGTGLLGIVVATIQQRNRRVDASGSITLTDVRPDVLERCQHNAKLPCNRSSSHPDLRVDSLDWNDASKDDPEFQTKLVDMDAELIIGADIVFDPHLISGLVCTLVSALELPSPSSKQREALVALTLRNPDTLALFLKAAEKHLQLEKLAFDDSSPFLGISNGSEKPIVEMYRLKKIMS